MFDGRGWALALRSGLADLNIRLLHRFPILLLYLENADWMQCCGSPWLVAVSELNQSCNLRALASCRPPPN